MRRSCVSRISFLPIVVMVAVGIGLPSVSVSQLQSGAIWPKYHANSANTGRSAFTGSNGLLKWAVYSGDSAATAMPGSPAIAADGTIYAGTSKALMAINESGGQRWKIAVGVSGTPAIGNDGTIFVNTIDNLGQIRLASVTPDGGTTKWLVGPFNYVFSSPSIGPDGTVYIGDAMNSSGYLYGYRKDSTVVKLSPGNGVVSSIAFAANGTIYFGTGNSNGHPHGQLMALNPTNGTTVFAYDADDFIFSPAVASNGNIYMTTQKSLTCLAPDGTVLFHIVDPHGILTAPTIAADGTVYYGSGSNASSAILNALNADGAIKWLLALTGANWINESPAIGSDGTLYAPVTVGGVNVIDAISSDGVLQWTSGPASLPAIGLYGTVVSMGLNAVGNTALAYGIPSASVAVTGLQIYPTSVEGGNLSTGTVTIASKAPLSGTTVYLTTDNPAASVPPYVVVRSGSNSASFQISTIPVQNRKVVNVSASAATQTASAMLAVTSPTISSFSLNPTTITGGQQTIGSLTLGSPAAPGTVVDITSDNPNLVSATSVTFTSGANTATLSMNTAGVSAQTTIQLTASLGASSQVASLKLIPAVLTGLQLTPTVVVGGAPDVVTGKITLNGLAPVQGDTVSLISSNPAVASVPPTVNVSAGATSVSFAVKHSLTSTTQPVVITATLNGISQSVTLTVNPFSVVSISVTPSSVAGGALCSGKLSISGTAPKGGLKVALNSNANSAQVPASVTVLEGTTFATFAVTTRPVTKSTTVTLSGKLGASTQLVSVIIFPATLRGVAVSPTSVVGGNVSQGTVTLTAPAPDGGTVITICADKSIASVPSSVTVPAGSRSIGFKISTSAVGASTVVILKASQGNLSRTCRLTVLPITILSITVKPSSVVGSSSTVVVGNITLSAPAGSAGAKVMLKSSSIATASVATSVTIPAGMTSGTFSVTHSKVTATRRVTISASFGTSTRSAFLTVTK